MFFLRVRSKDGKGGRRVAISGLGLDHISVIFNNIETNKEALFFHRHHRMGGIMSETATCFQQHHRMDLHFSCSSLADRRLKIGRQNDRAGTNIDYPCTLLYGRKTLCQGPFDAFVPGFRSIPAKPGHGLEIGSVPWRLPSLNWPAATRHPIVKDGYVRPHGAAQAALECGGSRQRFPINSQQSFHLHHHHEIVTSTFASALAPCRGGHDRKAVAAATAL